MIRSSAATEPGQGQEPEKPKNRNIIKELNQKQAKEILVDILRTP